MPIGLGMMQLLSVGRKQLLASLLHEDSVARRSKIPGSGSVDGITSSENFQHFPQRHSSLDAATSFSVKLSGTQSRNSGVVFCSESYVADSSSEIVQDEVDSEMSTSTSAMVVNSFSEAGIEVMRSIEDSENVKLKSVSALDIVSTPESQVMEDSFSVVESKNMLEQLREIVIFAGPALGIWLSGPIMSLIDTSVVGNSSALELAALGPGTVLCDQACYIFMFLSVATSNLVATALAQKNSEEAAGHLSRLLFVSLACGIGMLLFTWFGAATLISAFVGVKNAALVPMALPYVQIRAFAWPAVLVNMVAQSACLGMQDSWAPLRVLAIASAVNLSGDILLCTVLGCGIAGAAWATTASQYVAVILMLKTLNEKGYNTLAINIPTVKEFVFIINLAAPIMLTMVSKILFYTIITFLATSMGPVTLAAHQVMIGLYTLNTTWGEPLAQTAQSFMPALICGVDRNLQKAKELLKSLMIIGIAVGFTLGSCAVSVPWFFPQIFTKDLDIIAQMRLISVPFLFSLMITPPTLSLEGTLLAVRDLHFLGISMATCFVGGSIMLLIVNRLGFGLQGSWWMLAAFQWTRFFQAYSRLYSSRSVFVEPPLSHEEGSLMKIA